MKLTTALLLTLAGTAVSAQAHDAALNSQEIQPRIGRISDEVVRQRLVIAGLEGPEIVGRDAERIIVRATQNGQVLTLHVHALSGAIADERDPARQLSGLPGLESLRPTVLNSQLSHSRAQIADKALMPPPGVAPR